MPQPTKPSAKKSVAKKATVSKTPAGAAAGKQAPSKKAATKKAAVKKAAPKPSPKPSPKAPAKAAARAPAKPASKAPAKRAAGKGETKASAAVNTKVAKAPRAAKVPKISTTSKTVDAVVMLTRIAVHALEDLKGLDIRTLDVRPMTALTDTLLVCTGTSNRHAKSLADNVVEQAKKAGFRPHSVQGTEAGEWIIVDLGSVVVHVMQAQARAYYQLEKLWSLAPFAGLEAVS